MTAADFKKDVLTKLTYEERCELRLFLEQQDGPLESADESVEQAWDEEISRRIKEIDEGKVQLLDGDAVMEEMRQRFS